MTEHVDSATYFDIVEELGRKHLTQLDRAVENEDGYVLEDASITGYSYGMQRPKDWYGALEHSTIYRSSVYPEIGSAILEHPQPPEYIHTIVSALASAMVDHANVHHLGRHQQQLKPDPERLKDELRTIWLSFQATPSPLEDEAVIYRTAELFPATLRMTKYGGRLTLDYVVDKKYARIRF